MTITRYSAGERGVGKHGLPSARAVKADDWLYVSGRDAMEDGETVGGGIIAETRRTMENLVAIILNEAECGVGAGVWLDNPGDSSTFNGVYAEFFADQPVRASLRAVEHDGGLQSRSRLCCL